MSNRKELSENLNKVKLSEEKLKIQRNNLKKIEKKSKKTSLIYLVTLIKI